MPTPRALHLADAALTVEQVEGLRFPQSPEYRRQQIDAAYQRVLGRPVDLDGRIFWTAKLANTRIEFLLANLGSSRELYDKLGS